MFDRVYQKNFLKSSKKYYITFNFFKNKIVEKALSQKLYKFIRWKIFSIKVNLIILADIFISYRLQQQTEGKIVFIQFVKKMHLKISLL